MRVLVCGSRDWSSDADRNLLTGTLSGLYEEDSCGHMTVEMHKFALIQGGARGADAHAKWWAEQSPFHSHNERADDPFFEHLEFPADWKRHGLAAGPIRNGQMLEQGKPDLVLAFKSGFDWTFSHGGTEDMVRRAQRAGVLAYVISRAPSQPTPTSSDKKGQP